MRSDAYIVVTCDKCGITEEEVQLTALANGAYDERGITTQLRQWGWIVTGDEEICENCATAEESE